MLKFFERVFSKKVADKLNVAHVLLREREAALGRCLILLKSSDERVKVLEAANALSHSNVSNVSNHSVCWHPKTYALLTITIAIAITIGAFFVKLNRYKCELERRNDRLRCELEEKNVLLEGPDGLIQRSIDWAMLPIELPMPPMPPMPPLQK